MGGRTEAGEGREVVENELARKRFLWGVLLAWAPWVPTLMGLGYTLQGIWGARATGLGAVAGGLSELFVACGIGAILIGEIAAIVFLSRTFSRGHRLRSLFSFLSILMSSMMLCIVGLFLWLSWYYCHYAYIGVH